MPDPKLHLDDDGRVILPDLDSPGIPAHIKRAQIAACALCDPDGYRGSTVCDHQEHASAETRAAAREALRVALARNHTGVTHPVAPGDARGQESASGGER